MESSSEPNRVHVSKAFAKILRRQVLQYPLQPRGKREIKGAPWQAF